MAALEQEEMQGLAERAINLALKKGADEAEVFAYQGFNSNVVIERGQIARSARIIDQGLGIRAIVNKAVGFSYTNILRDKTATEEAVLKAVTFARASKPDEEWSGLPTRKRFASVESTYDKHIVELPSEELINVASIMLDAAEKMDKRAFPMEGGAEVSYLSRAVANSNGVKGFDQGTIVECSLATIAREGGEVTPVCFEFDEKRIYDLDPEWVGREAARLAVSALKARKTETRNTCVIFTPIALQQLLYFTLINAVKADYVQRGQSAFKGKIGENVASENLTIYDDGLLKGGLRTWKFDGEGVPQQVTPIIDRGILRNFIYDNYTAEKEGKESTGNASRAGYVSTPTVGATNFRFVPGTNTPEDLVGEVKDGILVYYLQGAHSSNPASGEFSVVATPAWKIKNGELAYATKGAMLAGNVFDVLRNVSALANNERKIGQLVAPWVRVEDVKVVGR